MKQAEKLTNAAARSFIWLGFPFCRADVGLRTETTDSRAHDEEKRVKTNKTLNYWEH